LRNRGRAAFLGYSEPPSRVNPPGRLPMHDVTMPMLWLPILLSAVAVMIGAASSGWPSSTRTRSGRWSGRGSADRGRAQAQPLCAGQYLFPHMMGEGGAQAATRKWEEGPVGVLLLRKPGKFSMGGTLFKSFIFYLVVSFFVAYVASHALSVGTEYLRVFQIAARAASWLTGSRWFPRRSGSAALGRACARGWSRR